MYVWLNPFSAVICYYQKGGSCYSISLNRKNLHSVTILWGIIRGVYELVFITGGGSRWLCIASAGCTECAARGCYGASDAGNVGVVYWWHHRVHCCIVALLLAQASLPDWKRISGIDWYLYCGGFLGVIFVSGMLYLMPKVPIYAGGGNCWSAGRHDGAIWSRCVQ